MNVSSLESSETYLGFKFLEFLFRILLKDISVEVFLKFDKKQILSKRFFVQFFGTKVICLE